jgi:putative MATE family efflux protein
MNSSPPSKPVGSSRQGRGPEDSPVAGPGFSPVTPGITRRVISLAWPAGVDQLIQTAVLFGDIVLLSRLGSEAIAGVGVCAVLVFTFAAVYNAVAVAATTVAAQAKGAQRPDILEKGAGQSILLAVLLGMVSGGLGAATAEWAMRMMGTDGLVRQYGVDYMRPVLLASPLYAIALAGGGVLRGTGDTRNPMIYSLASTLLKVFLSVALIFGCWGFPALGVTGAALATVFAYGLNALLVAAKLRAGFDGVRLGLRSIRLDRALAKRVLLLWLPVASELGIMRAGFIFYMRVVSSLGTIALAANQIAVRLESISLTMGFGFTVAATTLVGQAVGRRDLAGAERSAGVTAKLALLTMGTTAVVLIILRRWAVGMFSPEDAVLGPAIVCAVIGAFELLPLSFLFTFSGALRGAGDTVSPMIVSLLGTFVFRLPLVYLLGVKSGLGLAGIWYGTIIDWVLRSIVIYAIYRRGGWKTKAFISEPCRPGQDFIDSEGVCRE